MMVALFALVLILPQQASAQMTKLTVGYSAISGDQLPAWVAKETGIFEKNGLDVQLVFFTGGTTAVMALVSADTPISQVAGAGVINSAMAGSDAVLIVGASRRSIII
jgi:ABC-type nitrate/sulfonate/bicarbonate transport system substrate-binding protein